MTLAITYSNNPHGPDNAPPQHSRQAPPGPGPLRGIPPSPAAFPAGKAERCNALKPLSYNPKGYFTGEETTVLLQGTEKPHHSTPSPARRGKPAVPGQRLPLSPRAGPSARFTVSTRLRAAGARGREGAAQAEAPGPAAGCGGAGQDPPARPGRAHLSPAAGPAGARAGPTHGARACASGGTSGGGGA